MLAPRSHRQLVSPVIEDDALVRNTNEEQPEDLASDVAVRRAKAWCRAWAGPDRRQAMFDVGDSQRAEPTPTCAELSTDPL
jgi:hypothetical protein